MPNRSRRHGRGERRRTVDLLRTEAVGGALLVAAAILALLAANSPMYAAYAWLRDLRVGPAALDLHLSVAQWTSDGLLALFFFLAGLELKREMLIGELRDLRRAAVPVAAAVGGMAAPAGIYLLVNDGNPGAEVGWAIPVATDIAFALAVLAVVGGRLPPVLRTFLLTLAVVDDLLAIIIIAVAYTQALHALLLLAALVPTALFGLAVQRRVTAWWVLVPLALTAWALMHASGVHATVAGVLLGFTVPVHPRRASPTGHRRRVRGASRPARAGPDGRGQPLDLAGRLDRRLRPLSAGVAVPLFAFFAAGVRVGGPSGLAHALGDRVSVGIMAGLVVGKTIGILTATVLVSRLVRSPLLRGLGLPDLVGLAVLGGVGFTVSLLIAELAFGAAGERTGNARIAVLAGSVIAASVAAVILRLRNRRFRSMAIP